MDTVYYDVTGTDPRAWRASMPAAAIKAGLPGGVVAGTRWWPSWEYTHTRLEFNLCYAPAPVVQVEPRYDMPRLRSDSGVTPADAAEWRRFMISLWVHEEGHARRDMRGAAEELEVLRHLRTMDCGVFQQQARAATTAVVQRYIRLNQEYDARSRHGARQGAILIIDGPAIVGIDTVYRDTVP